MAICPYSDNMKKCVKRIDNMAIPDKDKLDVHKSFRQYKRQYLNSVGEKISENVSIRSYRVEHTHSGLNLRICLKSDSDKVKDIIALAEYADLTCIENRIFNNDPESSQKPNIKWLRFTIE